MFYQEAKINKILKCQICIQNLDEPRLLPCGATICNTCTHLIENKLASNSSKREFNCSICSKLHCMPNEGFSINLALLNLMTEAPDEIYRSEMVESLKQNVNILRKHLNQIDSDLKNGPDKIADHCIELRRLVQLSTEEKILEINQMNETLITLIDKYEKETILKYQSIKESLKTFELDTLKNNLNKFISETQEYLNNFRINDSQVKITNERAKIHKSNLLKEIKKFKLALFSNRIMNFVSNRNKFRGNILGSIKFQTKEDEHEDEDEDDHTEQEESLNTFDEENLTVTHSDIEDAEDWSEDEHTEEDEDDYEEEEEVEVEEGNDDENEEEEENDSNEQYENIDIDYQDDNDDGDEAQDDDEDSNSSDDIVSIQEAIARGVEEIENNEDLDYQEDNYWE